MQRALRIALLVGVVGIVSAGAVLADEPSLLTRSAPATSPMLPGPRPYYGQALGTVYYNWGYFGAKPHAQISRYAGYDRNRHQCVYSKGY